MKAKIIAALLAIACCQLFAAVTLAQGTGAGNVGQLWMITPKVGMADKFEAAFARHVDWRRTNNDPWHWDVYVQVDGADVGTYFARSGNHQWADFDGYGEFDRKATDNWNSTVAPYVARMQSTLSEAMPALSNWPADSADYHLFTIINYSIKQGHATRFNRSAKAFADILKDANWPYHWAFVNMVSGGAVPAAVLVLPRKNWAGMADPDPDLFAVVSAKVGPEAAIEMLDDFSDTIASAQAHTLQSLPQYTVEGAR